MRFTLILSIVFLILIGCKNTKNEEMGKKTTNSQTETQIIVNNRLIGFSYEPIPENEVLLTLPKGDSSDPNWRLDHGSISKIIELSISKIRLNYYSSEWKDIDSVKQFIIEILQDSESKTYKAPLWAHPSFVSIMCSIDYDNGTFGKWILCRDLWTSSIEDQSGNLWFATHKSTSYFPKKLQDKIK